jgi:hypothetical protein
MIRSTLLSRLLPAALLVVWMAGGAGARAAAAAPPKADVILDRYVEATGGRAAYQKIHNEVASGTMEFVGKNVKATITSYKAEGGKSYNEVEIPGAGKIEQGTDGQVAWESSALQGPRIKQGEERAAAFREADLSGDWRKLYKKVELAGEEDVDGAACYKVILTPDEGKPETRYYDKKTHLLVKASKIVKTAMGEIPADITLSDYKAVDGILSATKVRQSAIGQTFLITINSIQYNVEMPKNRFDLPGDVKTLLGKSEGGGKAAGKAAASK